MLSTTIVHVCARCGSERRRKNGHAINGAQPAKGLDGERAFILEPVEPVGPRDDPPCRAQVLAAYQDRMGARGIRRTFGVFYQTLLRWLGKKGRLRPLLRTRGCPAQKVTCSNSTHSGAL